MSCGHRSPLTRVACCAPTPTACRPDEADHRPLLRRALVASTVGSAIDAYDFLLYSTAAGLVVGQVFFPETDPTTGLLLAFGTYAVAFLSRPIGATFFGHFGDRIGRQTTLIATLVLMALGTCLIGVLPGYATIGAWGAIVLSLLRFVPGVGVGGEWGGAVLRAMELGHRDLNLGVQRVERARLLAAPQCG